MTIYNIALWCYECCAKLYARHNSKARLWVEGRKEIFERLEATIPSNEPIIWVHAASLGEFEQGRPIIEEIKRREPTTKILLTFFSPSGYEIRKNYTEADYIFYLPIDRRSYAERFLNIVKPKAAIFIKYEYWLNYLDGLRRRNIPTYLASAIFRRNSIFFRPWGGAWRRALKSYTTLFVQNEASKVLLKELGIEQVVVAGDTRCDRVAAIAQNRQRIPIVEQFAQGEPLLVAGSTWDPDEELLIELINQNPTTRFVIAPHEMNEECIKRLMQATKGGAARYTTATPDSDFSNTQLLILDTIGILSSLYSYARWAYIGGGFGVGIHNTLEATIFGVPVVFGPNYRKFQEACDLIAAGAARSITTERELNEWFALLRDDNIALQKASSSARSYTEGQCGATHRIVSTILPTPQ